MTITDELINNLLKSIKEIELFYKKMFEDRADSIDFLLKDNKTSVTQYDINATNFCIEHINKNFPNSNIWIEEDQEILTTHKDQLTWIIDPLDGTASFVRGYPVWGIGTAVLLNGEPILSHFYAPACNQAFLSYQNRIFFNNKEVIKVDKDVTYDTKTIFMSSRLHEKIDFKELYGFKVRNFGSTLYHLFMVATGNAESCIMSSCYIWDIAAVFNLADTSKYSFYEYNTSKKVSYETLLNYKSQKITTLLKFQKNV